MMRALAFALLALFATASFAETGPEKLPDPAQEARAVALQKEFRCLVCQGQSLDESNATLAEDLRKLIRARIAAGDTNAQIEHYLVARYGEFILMKPPLEPQTYGLWFGPFLVLLIGTGVAGTVILRSRPKKQA
jgi:cytochrome c-type biogenesis protein CcmH